MHSFLEICEYKKLRDLGPNMKAKHSRQASHDFRYLWLILYFLFMDILCVYDYIQWPVIGRAQFYHGSPDADLYVVLIDCQYLRETLGLAKIAIPRRKIDKNRNTALKIDRIPKLHFKMPGYCFHTLHLAILFRITLTFLILKSIRSRCHWIY